MTAKVPQHMQALEKANAVRVARAARKRQVDDGTVTAGAIILECSWEVATMTVADLLLSQRRWGDQRVSKFLATNHVSEVRTIESLTERSRRVLAAKLDSSIPRNALGPAHLAEARRGLATHETGVESLTLAQRMGWPHGRLVAALGVLRGRGHATFNGTVWKPA